MARQYITDQHKKGDRRTALLGLTAAEREKDKSACLTDEEMAILIDGPCTPDVRQRYLGHIAHCETCYRHWLELMETVNTAKSSKTKTNIYNLFKARNFAWAGSFLAAAASVVLFLQITRETPSPVLHQTMKATVERKDLQPSERNEDPGAVNSMSVSVERESDGLKGAVESKIETQREPVFSEPTGKKPGIIIQKHLRAKSIGKKEIKETGEINVDKFMRRPAASDLHKGQISVSSWLDRIRWGCRNREASGQFWAKQYGDGRQFTRYESAEEEQLVKGLLPLLEKMQQNGSNSQGICEQILQRLRSSPAK